MGRIPVWNPQVGMRPLSAPRAVPVSDGEGLRSLGRGLQQLGGATAEIATAAKREADQFREAQLDLEMGKEINDASWGDGGFMLKQGENALDPSLHLKRLEEARDRISGQLSGGSRDRWLLKANARIEEATASYERHSGGQRKVLFQTIGDGQAKLALESAALAYEDPAAVESALQKALVEPDGTPGAFVRALHDRGLPSEQVQIEVAGFKANGYAAAIQQHIQRGNLPGAKAALDLWRGQLGKASAGIEKTILNGEREQEAFVAAGEALRGAVGDNGYVDEAAARRAFATRTFSSPEAQQAADAAFDAGLKRANALKKADAMGLYKELRADFNVGGWGALQVGENAGKMARLNELDPDLHAKMYAAHLRRIEVAKKGEAERNRDQRDANDLGFGRFMALPVEERARIDIRGELDGVVPPGAAVELDEAGLLRLEAQQTKDRASVERGSGVAEAEVRRIARAKAHGFLGTRDKEAVAQFDAAVTLELQKWRQKAGNETRAPNAIEVEQMVAPLVTEFRRPSTIGGANTVRGYTIPASERRHTADEDGDVLPPPPKRIEKYLRSPDGTRRVPVYDDGTFGPEEAI